EVILDMIGCLDKMIEEAQRTMDPELKLTNENRALILKELDRKNDLVTQILSQDLQILSIIEKAKSGIIKELAQVRAAKKAVGSYKSGPAESQLNEKV
ncbi:MAG: hypothetical protein KDC67_16805, partial [Ignavibacteriae bacterium]|nr:hypothetical protein [Ignavibacteriota bacterium]